MRALPVLLLAAAAAFAAPSARDRAASEIAALRTGDWNERVHATHGLGELGAAGLPGLRLAAADADWQVRMTGVHLMGRLGEAAVPDLAQVLKTEPCRHVRLTALHWLGAIGGPRASEALRAGLGDESGMVRLMGRYWLDKADGRKESGFNPDESAAAGEDLKYCETSAAPRRAPWASARKNEDPAAEDQVDEPVVTPDPVAKVPAPAPEPNAVKPAPETLPDPPTLPTRTKTESAAATDRPLSRERLKELDSILSPESREAESFPPGTTGVPDHVPQTSGAEIMPDAGTGKEQIDPLPLLVKMLSDEDPRKRARAADDLGKRGARAAAAEPALRGALKDADKRVRASAALALGNLGPAADAAVPALVAALKRGPEEVEWSAAVALGRIGTPRSRRAFARYARQSAGDLVRRAPKD